MKHLIFSAIGCMMLSLACCQNDTLSITGAKHACSITEGRTIRVRTADHLAKGPMHIISDSTIGICGDTILLKDIERISVGRGRTAGAVLAGVGSAGDAGTAVAAILIADKHYGYWDVLQPLLDRLIVTSVGVLSVATTATGIILLHKGRNYDAGSYSFTIH